MKRTILGGLCAVLALAVGVAPAAQSAAAASPAPAVGDEFPAASMTAAYATAPCSTSGPSSADASLATSLNSRLSGTMDGYMTAYRVSCARKVVQAVQARGLAERAAVIAVTTTIVESTIQNVAEKVDHTSLGLFQQQDSWGSESQRLDPTWATNAFLNKMISLYPNNSWASEPIGEVCQRVQVSAYPDRYQGQASDGQIIVDALWTPPAVSVYGVLADGRLTYSEIESGTGRRLKTVLSEEPLGFTPKALATLNYNTLLVTSTAGDLHRVNIITNKTGVAFEKPSRIKVGGWTHTQLSYDGHGSLYGIN
ncbi:hypothetical protein AB0B85_23500, partial [Micromonospora sp. NPDC049044]